MTVTEAQVEWLEQRIDALNADLGPLRSFILPGGRPAAAYLHLARTICRRAERLMVELNDKSNRGSHSRGAEIRQSALRSSVRCRPLRERQRRLRRAVAARAEPLKARHRDGDDADL